MKVAKIMDNDTVNCIDGITVSLFMSGCPHHCKGCFNQETWNKKFGKSYSVRKVIKLISDKISKNDVERSFSILGGEPLAPYNIKNTNKIIKKIRKIYPNITIYLWSGYYLHEIENMKYSDSILSNIDYLIDGRFELDKKQDYLKLRGSYNQTIYRINHINEVNHKIESINF